MGGNPTPTVKLILRIYFDRCITFNNLIVFIFFIFILSNQLFKRVEVSIINVAIQMSLSYSVVNIVYDVIYNCFPLAIIAMENYYLYHNNCLIELKCDHEQQMAQLYP